LRQEVEGVFICFGRGTQARGFVELVTSGGDAEPRQREGASFVRRWAKGVVLFEEDGAALRVRL